jgi:hypothetical protein
VAYLVSPAAGLGGGIGLVGLDGVSAAGADDALEEA